MPVESISHSLKQPPPPSTSAEIHVFSLSSLVGCSAAIGEVYGCLMVFLIGTFLFPLHFSLCGFVNSVAVRSSERVIIRAQLLAMRQRCTPDAWAMRRDRFPPWRLRRRTGHKTGVQALWRFSMRNGCGEKVEHLFVAGHP